MTLLSYHLIDMILLKLSDLNTSIQLYRTYIAKKLITTILLNNIVVIHIQTLQLKMAT
jgi:hypothetical protein